jgi:hypothetical protein
MKTALFIVVAFITIVACLLTSGCATSPEPRAHDLCLADAPILVHCGPAGCGSSDGFDHLSDATARAILTHDKSGQEICSWKPPIQSTKPRTTP